MDKFSQDFINIINSYLKKHNINHGVLAENAGIKDKTRTIGRWLNNEQKQPNITVPIIKAISSALDEEHQDKLNKLILDTKIVLNKVNREEFPNGQFKITKKNKEQ